MKKRTGPSREPTRRDDDRLLEWLHLRAQGKSTRQIAEAYGTTKNTVIGALNRVDKEDVDKE
jgi:transposase